MKKILSVIILFVISLTFILPVSAQEYKGNWEDMPKVNNSNYINDLGGYLTPSQIEEFEATAKTMIENYGMAIVVVTTNDSLGRTAKAYGEDFYEANGYGIGEDISGIVFTVDMDNRKIDLRAYGKARRLFTETNVDLVLNSSIEPLLEDSNDVYGTISTFLTSSEVVFINWQHYIDNGGVEDYTPNIRSPFYLDLELILLGSFLISGIIILLMVVFHNKSLPKTINGLHYSDKGEPNYSQKTDTFIGTHTSRTRIADTSSGGGSGGGSSFSGRSSFGSSSSGRGTSGGSRSF